MANSNHQPLDNQVLDKDEDVRKMMLEAVPVPENLNVRIKARLREVMLADAGVGRTEYVETMDGKAIDAETEKVETSADREGITTTSVGERTRRTIVLIALAASLSGLAFLVNQWRQPNEREWLVQHCQSILGSWELDNPANLELDSNLSELPSPVREQLARVTLRGTRSVSELGSKFKGTLYRLDAIGGQSLVLIRLSDLPAVRGLNSRFSILPTPSGGWSLIALQVNNETFVLAAQCTEQEMMNYIRRPVVT